MNNNEGMGIVAMTVARWVRGFIMLFGFYLILDGDKTAGGGFAGGIIIACAFILIVLAEGKNAVSKHVASRIGPLGAVVFLLLALFGLVKSGIFFKNYKFTGILSHYFGSGLIAVADIAIGLMLGISVFLIFSVLAGIRIEEKNGERNLIHRDGE